MKPLLRPFAILTMSLITLTTNPALAAPDYRCVIQRIVTAEQAPNSILTFNERNYLGKEFSVDRSTGLMVGALKNSFVTKPQVVDPGSKENSFKVVTSMNRPGGGANISVLNVNEHSTSPKKPFVFVENDVVFLGVCEHF